MTNGQYQVNAYTHERMVCGCEKEGVELHWQQQLLWLQRSTTVAALYLNA